MGLDPRQITEIRDLIQRLGQARTVILSSHILGEVQAVCGTILILSKGRLVACDTPENLQRLTSGTALELEIMGKKEAVLSALKGLEYVQSTTLETTPGGRIQVRLETGKESLEALSQAAFFRLAERKLPLLRMTPVKASLEEIFLELTEGKEEG